MTDETIQVVTDNTEALKNALDEIESLRQQLADAQAQIPRWIPVEERLPEEGVEVLCLLETEGDPIQRVCLRQETTVNGVHWHYEWEPLYSYPYYMEPTHWMPLPPAPGEE